MSQHRIKIVPRKDPNETEYQAEIRQDFEQICTALDELIAWARTHAPAEVVAKLEFIKSFTMVPGEKPN